MSFASLPWVWMLAAVVAAGILLILGALFPRRRGTTRYCRVCGYNLTGAPSPRCPECGTELGERTVVTGERRVRRARLAAGVACALLGGALLWAIAIGVGRNVNWYAHMPAGVLLLVAQSSDDARAEKALTELAGRLALGDLPLEHLSRLADVCLAEQTRPELRANVGVLAVNLLGDLHAGGVLSDEQETRFFQNMVTLKLRARRTVVEGDLFPVVLLHQTRAPDEGLFCRVSLKFPPAIPSERLAGPVSCAGGGCGHGELSSHILAAGSGRHELTCQVEVAVLEGDLAALHDARQLHKRKETLAAIVEVLPKETPRYIELARSTELDAAVSACVSIGEFWVDLPDTGNGAPVLKGFIKFAPRRPMDLALEALAHIDSQELLLGRLKVPRRNPNPAFAAGLLASASAMAPHGTASVPAGEPGSMTFLVGSELQGQPPERISLILRASKHLATQMLDVYRIWGGELRFDGIEVEIRQPTTSDARRLRDTVKQPVAQGG